jgi:hypothetical protein
MQSLLNISNAGKIFNFNLLVNNVFILLLYDSIGLFVVAYPGGVLKICQFQKVLSTHCFLKYL